MFGWSRRRTAYFRIRKPKTKKPPVQRVLVEASFIIKIFAAVRDDLGETSDRIAPWTIDVQSAKWHNTIVALHLEEDLSLSKKTLRGGWIHVEKIVTRRHLCRRCHFRLHDHLNCWKGAVRGSWAGARASRHHLHLVMYDISAWKLPQRSERPNRQSFASTICRSPALPMR